MVVMFAQGSEFETTGIRLNRESLRAGSNSQSGASAAM